MKKHYLPVLIDLHWFNPLVIGGGKIALRKVNNLLDFNSFPTIISPKINSELINIIKSNNLIYIQKYYETKDITNFNLIFAATNNIQVNNQIFEDCMNRNILVNIADEPNLCNFIMPASIIKNNITISISSQGQSPFFSKYLKNYIESSLPDYINDISDFASILRKQMKSLNIYNNISKRNKLIKEFLDTNWNQIFVNNNYDFALNHLLNMINKYK